MLHGVFLSPLAWSFLLGNQKDKHFVVIMVGIGPFPGRGLSVELRTSAHPPSILLASSFRPHSPLFYLSKSPFSVALHFGQHKHQSK